MYSMTVVGCNLNPSEGGGDMITGCGEEFQWAQPPSSYLRTSFPVLDIFLSLFSPLSSLHSTILTMIMIMREIYGDMMTKARLEFWWATGFNLTNSNSHYLDSQLGNKNHLWVLSKTGYCFGLMQLENRTSIYFVFFSSSNFGYLSSFPLKQPNIFWGFGVIFYFPG